MPIMRASDLSFASAPRCPVCDVGILPYGKHEPFAVNASGQPYCRDHGAEIEPSYPEVYEQYKNELRARRLEAIRVLREEEPRDSVAPSR